MMEDSCCFTGHREIKSEKYAEIGTRTQAAVIDMIEKGVVHFYAGGARGFDTLAEEIVLEARKKHPQVTLTLILPFAGHNLGQSPQAMEKWLRIIKEADEVRYASDGFTKGSLLLRNRMLVENCGHCICYLTKKTGGTAYTVSYAQTKGLTITNVAYDMGEVSLI